MRKPITLAVPAVALGVLLLGFAHAQQQTPPASSSQGQSQNQSQNPPAKSTTPQGTKSGASSSATKKPGPAPLVLTTPRQKASYAFGLNMGEGMKKNSVDLDPTILMRGLKDGLAGSKPLMTDDEVRATITAFQTDLRKKQQEKMEALATGNKTQGEAFLAANKTKEGVVPLPSGLQYKILQQGDGPKPTATDTVVCNYRGTLLDNTEFDSSYKRGQPATFPVTGVIKGWTEALQLMPVGSKWELFVPPDLAYGARGTPGGNIGPNATLIFEVELLSIKPKTPPAVPATPNPGANPPANPNAPPTPNPTPNPAQPNPNPTPTPPPNPNPPPNPTPTPKPNPPNPNQ
jgi:FKBP-type peptidyl-prolyl cis-trans isomerase FklB